MIFFVLANDSLRKTKGITFLLLFLVHFACGFHVIQELIPLEVKQTSYTENQGVLMFHCVVQNDKKDCHSKEIC